MLGVQRGGPPCSGHREDFRPVGHRARHVGSPKSGKPREILLGEEVRGAQVASTSASLGSIVGSRSSGTVCQPTSRASSSRSSRARVIAPGSRSGNFLAQEEGAPMGRAQRAPRGTARHTDRECFLLGELHNGVASQFCNYGNCERIGAAGPGGWRHHRTGDPATILSDLARGLLDRGHRVPQPRDELDVVRARERVVIERAVICLGSERRLRRAALVVDHHAAPLAFVRRRDQRPTRRRCVALDPVPRGPALPPRRCARAARVREPSRSRRSRGRSATRRRAIASIFGSRSGQADYACSSPRHTRSARTCPSASAFLRFDSSLRPSQPSQSVSSMQRWPSKAHAA